MLLPCPSCRRHVRTDEVQCPFCAAKPLAALLLAGAALAGAAGCGGKTAPATNNTVENVAIDAGAIDAVAPDAAPSPDADEWHRMKMPYGAPPVRERLV